MICSAQPSWRPARLCPHVSPEHTLSKDFFQQEHRLADLPKCAIGHEGGEPREYSRRGRN